MSLMVQNWRKKTSLDTGRSGEFALAQAVMIDAICLLAAHSKHVQKLNKKQREVWDWIDSNDAHWGYSFVNICHYLNWEPDWARKLITQGINPFHCK